MSAVTLNDNDLKKVMSAPETVLLTTADSSPRRMPFFATVSGKRVLEGGANVVKYLITPLLLLMLFIALWALI